MSNETILPNLHKFAYETVGLYFCARPDLHALLDLYEWANKTIICEFAFVDIGRLDDFYASAANDVSDLHLPKHGGAVGHWEDRPSFECFTSKGNFTS